MKTMKYTLYVAFAAAIAIATPRAESRPNVLLIISDDLQLNECQYAHTPNLDTLQEAGELLPLNCFTVYSWCNPSRTSLMSGLLPSQHGVWDNSESYYATDRLPDRDWLTLALQRAGYDTFGMGKVMHSGREEWNIPGWTNYNYAKSTPSESLATFSSPDGEWSVFPDEVYQKDEHVKDLALQRIALLSETDPWFMAVGFWKPHKPIHCSQSDWDINPGVVDGRFGETLTNYPKRPFLNPSFSEEYWHDRVRAYQGAITAFDRRLAEIRTAMQLRGLWDNTLVIITSDNGVAIGEGGRAQPGKVSPYLPGNVIPLWIKPPQGRPVYTGETTAIADTVDLHATILDYAGAASRDGTQGDSLRPVLERGEAGNHRYALSLTRNPRKTRYYTRVTTPWETSIRQFLHGNPERGVLFDRTSDPRELTNISQNYNHPTTATLHAAYWEKRKPVPIREERAATGEQVVSFFAERGLTYEVRTSPDNETWDTATVVGDGSWYSVSPTEGNFLRFVEVFVAMKP